MIRFSLYEIIRSTLAAVIFAVVMCAIYEIFILSVHTLTIIFYKSEYYIYKKGNNIKKIATELKAKILENANPPWLKYCQFVFTFSFGIAYIIMQYVFCDGVFRVYFLSSVLVAFLISKRFFRKRLGRLLLNFSVYLVSVLVFSVSLFLTPIYFITVKTSRKAVGLFVIVRKILKVGRGVTGFRQK